MLVGTVRILNGSVDKFLNQLGVEIFQQKLSFSRIYFISNKKNCGLSKIFARFLAISHLLFVHGAHKYKPLYLNLGALLENKPHYFNLGVREYSPQFFNLGAREGKPQYLDLSAP